MSYRKHLMPSDISPSVAYGATAVDSDTDTISREKLISESAFYEAIYKLPIREEKADGENYYYLVSIADIFKMLEKLQPAQPEPKRGKWIDKGITGDWQYQTDGRGRSWHEWQCDQCKDMVNERSFYCPNCEAEE